MKKILTLLIGTCGLFTYAQVAIGKNTVDGANTILDFASGTNNGIILPKVATLPVAGTTQEGSFLVDTTDKIVKYCDGTAWKPLTDAGNATVTNTNTDGLNGVIIGAASSTAKGALILETTNKAMILPKISNPHTNVPSPVAGMMCYDTTSKTVAIYDGLKWSYWK